MRKDVVLLLGDAVSILDRGDTAEEGGEVAGRSRFGVVMLTGFCIVKGDRGTVGQGGIAKGTSQLEAWTGSRGSIGCDDHFCMQCRALVQG
jgi:hypothetical protein